MIVTLNIFLYIYQLWSNLNDLFQKSLKNATPQNFTVLTSKSIKILTDLAILDVVNCPVVLNVFWVKLVQNFETNMMEVLKMS